MVFPSPARHKPTTSLPCPCHGGKPVVFFGHSYDSGRLQLLTVVSALCSGEDPDVFLWLVLE